MPRFIDFNRSEREIPFGSMDEYGDEVLTDRLEAGELRRPLTPADDDQAIKEQIQSVVSRFDNKPSASGSVRWKRPRIRPEALYVELFLTKAMTNQPPRVLARARGLNAVYVSNAIGKGGKLIRAMAAAGAFDDLGG